MLATLSLSVITRSPLITTYTYVQYNASLSEYVLTLILIFIFFFQAEDGIRDAQESRGLGDVYKRQSSTTRVS